ncbi:MAG: HEAT repeat domain-containing protein [Candidatus Binatia bacterium]
MKLRIGCLLSLLLSWAWPGVVSATEAKTFYDYLERAWAVGEVRLSAPMKFRDGKLLAFPGQITDLAYAKVGKPRSILLIHEVREAEAEPLFEAGTVFVGPINLLPRYSYWRDSLPNTPHHQVPGGRRYVFTAEDAAPALEIAKSYTAALGMKMPRKAVEKVTVQVRGLGSGVRVIVEDSARELAANNVLSRDLNEESLEALLAFVKSGNYQEERVLLVEAMGFYSVDKAAERLEKLASRDDEVGAAALLALERLKRPRSTGRLLALLDATTLEVRIYAAETLGRRVGEDENARAGVLALLESDAQDRVRGAAALGMGSSGWQDGLGVLRKALYRGDGASRAAAMGLARLDTEEAAETLMDAVVKGPDEAMVGSVAAMVKLSHCPGCAAFLADQYKSHEEEGIRDLIGLLLELDKGGHSHEDDKSSFAE